MKWLLQRVWSCNKHSRESSSGFGSDQRKQVLGKKQIMYGKTEGAKKEPPEMQQWPQEGGWRTGVHTRTSLFSKELSSEGFKIYKDSDLETQRMKKCIIGKSG